MVCVCYGRVLMQVETCSRMEVNMRVKLQYDELHCGWKDVEEGEHVGTIVLS